MMIGRQHMVRRQPVTLKPPGAYTEDKGHRNLLHLALTGWSIDNGGTRDYMSAVLILLSGHFFEVTRVGETIYRHMSGFSYIKEENMSCNKNRKMYCIFFLYYECIEMPILMYKLGIKLLIN